MQTVFTHPADRLYLSKVTCDKASTYMMEQELIASL